MSQTAIKPKRVLPGFSLSLGTTLLYVALIILIPVVALILKGAEIGPGQFWAIVAAMVFAVASRWFWRFGVRRYAGASA